MRKVKEMIWVGPERIIRGVGSVSQGKPVTLPADLAKTYQALGWAEPVRKSEQVDKAATANVEEV